MPRPRTDYIAEQARLGGARIMNGSDILVRRLQRSTSMVFRTHEQDQRSLGQLFSDATRETSDLVSKEIELAKLEIGEAIANLRTGTASIAVAAALLFAGLLVLLLAAVLALDLALHRPWLSALLIGIGVCLLGVIAGLAGRRHLSGNALTPRRSVESIREDTKTLQEHLPGGS